MLTDNSGAVRPEILTLLGIGLGWLLSSISATFKFRNERRADLSMAVSRLLPMLTQLTALKGPLETFKDTTKSWQEYERIRWRLWQRHGRVLKSLSSENINKVIDDVAKHKPILAIQIRGLVDLSTKLPTNDISETSKASQEAYVKLLSALEVAHEGLMAELQRAIRNLSWSASIGRGLSYELYMRKRGGGRKLRTKNAESIKKLHLDVWDDVAGASSDADTAPPTAPAPPRSPPFDTTTDARG